MLEEAENLNFEKAATLRDEINKLQRKGFRDKVTKTALITGASKELDYL